MTIFIEPHACKIIYYVVGVTFTLKVNILKDAI